MRREPRAFLLDVIDFCDAIATAIVDLEPEAYAENRLVRSAVERKFIPIDKAVDTMKDFRRSELQRIRSLQAALTGEPE